MKTQIKDQYDFGQASPTAQPGFEVFQQASGTFWFFHGNDVEGLPALFSQPYSSSDAAHRGLNAAIVLLKKQPAAVREDSTGWYFTLQSGNNQELARSRPFPDREQCEKMQRYFQKVAGSPNPLVKQPGKVAKNAKQQGKTGAQDFPARYSFRLFFYPTGKNMPLSGRIEHIQNQEQATFKGLDGAAIAAFLQQQIPEFAGPTPAVPPVRRENVRALPAVLATSGSASMQEPVELVLTAEGIPAGCAVEGCTLALRHMDTQKLTALHNVEARQGQNGQIQIRLNASGLPAGTYHLSASVWLQDQPANASAVYRLQGTGWLQLV